MKVLMINGSPRVDGNTTIALHSGKKPMACRKRKLGSRHIFSDNM